MSTDLDKIFNRIKRHGNGWSFSRKDFADLATTSNIVTILHRLNKRGKIRRLLDGLYDLPGYSKFLGEVIPPDLHQIAYALARKFSWSIQPSGNAALNRLGLSTQVPAKVLYLSDGPNRAYQVSGNQELIFKKAPLMDSKLKSEETRLIIQAIRTLGKERMEQSILHKIRLQIPKNKIGKIEREAQYITGWVYDVIKKICEGED